MPYGTEISIRGEIETEMSIRRRIPTIPAEFSPALITDEEATAIFRHWDISDEQAATLLDLPVRTFRRWKADGVGRIDRDGKARLSNIMGIHKALRIIFSDPHGGYAWIKVPNEAFANRSALHVMLGGELTDLMRVRRYLDAERGGWRSMSRSLPSRVEWRDAVRIVRSRCPPIDLFEDIADPAD